MKKHLFLLSSFMSVSLVAVNTLLVIGCTKKASNEDEQKDEEKDTNTVILNKKTKLKDKIREIIDNVITNSSDSLYDEDWLIELDSSTITTLNNAVDSFKKVEAVEKKEMILNDVPNIKQDFVDKIKAKFADLKVVIKQVIENSEDLGVSNFEFNFVSESIEPILADLNGIQFMQAILRLNKKSTGYALTANNFLNSESIDLDKKIEIFKVKTNLSYNFSFDGGSDTGDYIDAELLLTENKNNYKIINKQVYKAITTMINGNEKIKNVEIYNGDLRKNEDYYNIGKKMNWDFSEQVVKDEIKQMQFKNIKDIILPDIPSNELKDLLIMEDNLEFEIDSKNYMKFNNSKMDIKRLGEDNVLFLDGVHKEEMANKVITAITKQFQFDGSEPFEGEADPWNGGKINHEFIEQAKKDSATEDESGNVAEPKIKLSDYYGFGKNYSSDDVLIGYGKTTIWRPRYASIMLPKININTSLIIPNYGATMAYLYDGFRDYVKALLQAFDAKNTVGIGLSDSEDYVAVWRFNSPDIWNNIKNKLANPESNKTVSFEWIMNNILFERVKDSRYYKRAMLTFPEPESRSFLNTDKEVKYVQRDDEDTLMVDKDYLQKPMPLYLKCGPFVVYLAGNDSRASWSSRPIYAVMER